MSDFYRILEGRRSIRKYGETPVSRELLELVIKVGSKAPSAHNAQPWRYVVIEGENHKKRLAEAMGSNLRRDLEADGEPPETIESEVSDSIHRFSTAPVLLLAGLTMKSMDSYPDTKRQQAERVMGIQSVAAALQNILLAIHAEGLGACWYCAPLFCPETVRQTLGLANDFHPQALITIGYPAETPPEPERRPVSEIITFLE